ncbi:MAG: threonine-phosphate decarboxylase [Halocynthiibacter sp.]
MTHALLKQATRDHGGGLDAAIQTFGGRRDQWLDLSTGINPIPWPLPEFTTDAWTRLPDQGAVRQLCDAARDFWNVPDGADILPCHGASAAIARLPALSQGRSVQITTPTYNEHAASFRNHGWDVSDHAGDCRVVVHPNNPDGRLWNAEELTSSFTVIDESFCDICPDQSHIIRSTRPGTIVLKSFGKFWGLAGLRLGFVIGDPALVGHLREILGPWSVSGPALEAGTAALQDLQWASDTRTHLASDTDRLDTLMVKAGLRNPRGTTLFRLYDTANAQTLQNHLAQHHIWSRIFPYSDSFIRLGLPGTTAQWHQLETAISTMELSV